MNGKYARGERSVRTDSALQGAEKVCLRAGRLSETGSSREGRKKGKERKKQDRRERRGRVLTTRLIRGVMLTLLEDVTRAHLLSKVQPS